MVEHKEAMILYPGDAKGRPTVELRIYDDGSNEKGKRSDVKSYKKTQP